MPLGVPWVRMRRQKASVDVLAVLTTSSHPPATLTHAHTCTSTLTLARHAHTCTSHSHLIVGGGGGKRERPGGGGVHVTLTPARHSHTCTPCPQVELEDLLPAASVMVVTVTATTTSGAERPGLGRGIEGGVGCRWHREGGRGHLTLLRFPNGLLLALRCRVC